jgi:hypothetical protein
MEGIGGSGQAGIARHQHGTVRHERETKAEALNNPARGGTVGDSGEPRTLIVMPRSVAISARRTPTLRCGPKKS